MQGKLFIAIIHFTKWPYFADHKLLAGSGDTKYAVLQSFDLICDSTEEQQLWYKAVSSLYTHYNFYYDDKMYILTVEETHFTQETCEHVCQSF